MKQSELFDLAIIIIIELANIYFDEVIHKSAVWKARKEKF